MDGPEFPGPGGTTAAGRAARERVRDAYSARAAEYTQWLGSVDAWVQQDRDLIVDWAEGVEGTLLDVGCGPGHWTNLLHERGVDVVGIDPVDAFVTDATRRYPAVRYLTGTAESLDVPDGRVGGILAWYSLIHLHPDELHLALDEFARVLRPGGQLLVGFFTGPRVAAFDHAITPGWLWPVPELSRRLEDAGFGVTGTHALANWGTRHHSAISARRSEPRT